MYFEVLSNSNLQNYKKNDKSIIDVSDCRKKVFAFFLKVMRLKSVLRICMSEGSEFHADDTKLRMIEIQRQTVFEAGTQSSQDDADLR